MSIVYSVTKWDELTKEELYAILKLRQEVFIVEQDCPYLDADDKDQDSQHVMLESDGRLIGYARLLPLGLSYIDYVSIGRVIINASERGHGYGYPLMEYSKKQCCKLWPGMSIKISAQAQLQKFYSQCGFSATGETYLEDDIPHIAMVLTL